MNPLSARNQEVAEQYIHAHSIFVARHGHVKQRKLFRFGVMASVWSAVEKKVGSGFQPPPPPPIDFSHKERIKRRRL